MSLQKAIEILEEYHETAGRYEASHEIVTGVNMCISLLTDKLESECEHTWEPSEDTQYKRDLTNWIIKKKWFEGYERIKNKDVLYKDQNPYSIFEAWQNRWYL